MSGYNSRDDQRGPGGFVRGRVRVWAQRSGRLTVDQQVHEDLEVSEASVRAARGGQRGVSIAAVIYRDLRGEIVSLLRKPYDPLNEKQIAATYGVSRTPVREALLKLADEGLIEVYPQSGTFVSRIPLDRLPEAFAIRKALEEATVRYAAQRATRSQTALLQANLELQREMEEAGNLEGFHEADEAFHKLIAEIAGYPGFWPVIQQVKIQVDRVRRLTLPLQGRIGVVIAEHVKIVEAIAGNDAECAVAALAYHLADLEGMILRSREANPLYFK